MYWDTLGRIENGEIINLNLKQIYIIPSILVIHKIFVEWQIEFSLMYHSVRIVQTCPNAEEVLRNRILTSRFRKLESGLTLRLLKYSQEMAVASA